MFLHTFSEIYASVSKPRGHQIRTEAGVSDQVSLLLQIPLQKIRSIQNQTVRSCLVVILHCSSESESLISDHVSKPA
jgi:hypothetical protein